MKNILNKLELQNIAKYCKSESLNSDLTEI